MTTLRNLNGKLVMNSIIAILAIAAGGILWRESSATIDVSPDPKFAQPGLETAIRSAEAESQADSIPALSELEATRLRPLFSPDRQPPDVTAAGNPEPLAALTDGLSLVGMMRVGTGGGRAMIRLAASPLAPAASRSSVNAVPDGARSPLAIGAAG